MPDLETQTSRGLIVLRQMRKNTTLCQPKALEIYERVLIPQTWEHNDLTTMVLSQAPQSVEEMSNLPYVADDFFGRLFFA